MPINIPMKAKGYTYKQEKDPQDDNKPLRVGDTWLSSLLDYSYVWCLFENGHQKWIKMTDGYGFSIMAGFMFGSTNASSTTERITFPFESGDVVDTGTLSTLMALSASLNSSKSGYLCGSFHSLTYVSSIDKFDFPFSNGTSVSAGNLSSITSGYCSGCNSSKNGYVTNGGISSIQRLNFPFSGSGSIVGNSINSCEAQGMFNSSNQGFCLGGQISSNTLSYIEKFDFPFEGDTIFIGNLSGSFLINGCCNSENHGFTFGGYLGGDNASSSIQRILFPYNSGNSIVVSNLSNSKRYSGGSNSSNHGFSFGANTMSGFVSTIERITFPFDNGSSQKLGNLTHNLAFCHSAIDTTDFNGLFVN